MAATTGTHVATVGVLAATAGWAAHVTVLHRRYTHDPLTSTLTAAAWRQRAERLVRHHPRAVIGVIDLDGFKGINDAHGHVAGDAVLAATGARLRRALPVGGLAGRLGGDEFALAVPHPLAAADLHCLHTELTAPLTGPGGIRLASGASMGLSRVADLPQPSLCAAVQAADTAMYAAKQRRTSVSSAGENAVPLARG